MMRVIASIVALRWALTWSVLRKSVWQTIGSILVLLLAGGTVVGVAQLALFCNSLSSSVDTATLALWLNTGAVLAGSMVALIVVCFQLILTGESSTMSPRRFELYGIPDRTLQAGLLVSGLSGIPALCGLLSFLVWAMAYRWMGIDVVVAAVVCAPLAVITLMCISKLVISLATTMVRSTRGRNIFYCVAIIFFVVMCQLPSMMMAADGESFNIETLRFITPVAQWTPLGAAFQIPFDVFAGNWFHAIARVAILAVTWVLCFMGSTWCLRRERLTAGLNAPSVTAQGIGAFAWMPDSVSGALSARLFTYLRRDPRQGLMFIFPLLFVVVYAIQSQGESLMTWQGLLWGGIFIALIEANGLSYDGRGFTMQVIAGVRGFDDRCARVRVYATLILIYDVILSILCFAITGDWASLDGILTGLTFIAVSLAVAYCGLGLGEVLSCVLMYPVPSIDKPFSTPQGRAVAQSLFPLVAVLGTIVLILPVGVVALALFLTGQWSLYWVLIPVSLADGIGFLVLGSWLGGKLMDARMLEIMHTLDSFASLQK